MRSAEVTLQYTIYRVKIGFKNVFGIIAIFISFADKPRVFHFDQFLLR